MKRKPQPYDRDIWPVRVYYDDLLEIESIIGSISPDLKMQLETDDHIFESVEDLPSIKRDKLKELRIGGWQCPITLSLKQTYLSLSAKEDTLIVSGACTRIEDVLRRCRKNWCSRFIKGRRAPLIVSLLSTAFLILVYATTNLSIIQTQLFIISVITFQFTLTYFALRKDYCEIYTTVRAATPSFFKRNKDAIVVQILVGISIAIISYLIGLGARP